jgi:hypothetical protein
MATKVTLAMADMAQVEMGMKAKTETTKDVITAWVAMAPMATMATGLTGLTPLPMTMTRSSDSIMTSTTSDMAVSLIKQKEVTQCISCTDLVDVAKESASMTTDL